MNTSTATWKCIESAEWSDTFQCILCKHEMTIAAEDYISDFNCPVCEKAQPLMKDGGCVDTLIALVEQGPLWDGDVPSKSSRDELIEAGLAVRVCVKGEDGYTAATYVGRDVYNARYGGDTIPQAMANRKSEISAMNRKLWEKIPRAEYTGSCADLAKNIRLSDQVSDNTNQDIMGD